VIRVVVCYNTGLSYCGIMADHHEAADNDRNNMFVYTGGRVPEHLRRHMTHARVDESVSEIDNEAFDGCEHLLWMLIVKEELT